MLHGGEADIYNAGGFFLNVADGQKVIVISWKQREIISPLRNNQGGG